MKIHLCTNVIKKYFYLLYPTQSLDIVIIHMSDYQGAKTFAVATFVAAIPTPIEGLLLLLLLKKLLDISQNPRV